MAEIPGIQGLFVTEAELDLIFDNKPNPNRLNARELSEKLDVDIDVIKAVWLNVPKLGIHFETVMENRPDENRLSAGALAEDLGISEHTVNKKWQQMDKNGTDKTKYLKTKLSPNEMFHLERFRRDGVDYIECGKRLGALEDTIVDAIEELRNRFPSYTFL